MPSHCTPAQCVLFFFFFLPRAFQEEEFIGLSSTIQGLNVVIYKKPTGAQKKSKRSHFGAVRGVCGSKRLWQCALTLGVLYGAFKSSAWALSASHAAEQDKNIPVTTAALKEIPSWFHASRGLEETSVTVLLYSKAFFLFFLFFGVCRTRGRRFSCLHVRRGSFLLFLFRRSLLSWSLHIEKKVQWEKWISISRFSDVHLILVLLLTNGCFAWASEWVTLPHKGHILRIAHISTSFPSRLKKSPDIWSARMWCDVLIFLIRVSLKCTSAWAGGDERVRFGKNTKGRNRVKHNVIGRKLLLRFLINKGTGPHWLIYNEVE